MWSFLKEKTVTFKTFHQIFSKCLPPLTRHGKIEKCVYSDILYALCMLSMLVFFSLIQAFICNFRKISRMSGDTTWRSTFLKPLCNKNLDKGWTKDGLND